MSRQPRKPSATGIYHVMLRGVNRQSIFEEPADYERFLETLLEVKLISGFKLFAYCLMTNHVHLLMKEENEPLSQIFRRIGVRYAAWFNQKYDRCGHLFQDRFKSEPVESDAYFITVLVYIHQNPVKAGLCTFSSGYKWSSRRVLESGGIIDSADLFAIVSLREILEKERIEAEEKVGMEIGTMRTLTDDGLLERVKTLGNAKSISDFLDSGLQTQAVVFAQLREQGASIRQLSRVTGIGRDAIEYLCRVG